MQSRPTRTHQTGSWLMTCDFGESIDQIAAKLGLDDVPRIELSADGWRDDDRALRTIAAWVEQYGTVHSLNPNAVAEVLGDALALGHLVVIRGIYPSSIPAIAQLVLSVDSHIRFGRAAPGRVAVVLEGWQPAEITASTPVAWETDQFQVGRLQRGDDIPAR
jgi:hypothetical protein